MNNEENSEKTRQNDSATRERLQNLSRRGLNAATGGAWNKIHNAPIIGAAAKRAENKVADKLGNSKLGQRLANHQRPNLGVPTTDEENKTIDNNSSTVPKNNDIGSQNLRSSIANKAKNLWNQRKKKNDKADDKPSDDENTSSGEEESNSEESDSNTEPISQEKKVVIKSMRIKIVMIAGFAFMFYFLVMTIASALTGGGVFKVAPVSSVKDYGTDSFQSVTSEDSPAHKDELAFYQKIKDVIKENDADVNMNYVVAILMEVFYEYDSSYIYENNEDAERLMESGGIDYAKMTNNVDTFVKVIKELDSTDYEIGGEIYNALKNNNDFKNYYKEALKSDNKRIDDILNNIFALARELDVDNEYDDTTITDETNVVNNQNQNMTMNQYMNNSIYASSNRLDNKELIKAYTVAYATNVVATNKKLTINSNYATTSNKTCNVKEGCSYNSNGELVNGAGLQNSQNTIYYNGGYYYRTPLTSDEQKELNNTINSTFGNVLVKSDGTYPKLDISILDGFGDGDGDYKEILKKAYGDGYKYKNVGENSYILDGSYGDKKVKTEVIFYDQKDYPNTKFCGLNGYTIGGSGCGVTAMAIVASTYENNKKYDPIYMNNEARKKGLCGKTGTSQAFFGKEASALKYKYSGGTKYNKSILNLTLKHLSQGHLVVVRMGSGHFTGGGHYMVLGGVDPETKKVYVYDPNNKSNSSYRKTGNGWYSFNDIIVKEAYNFYVIWKG